MKKMHVKSDRPIRLLTSMGEVHPLVTFMFEINQLKLLYRQGWLNERGVSKLHCESVADHIFSMSTLAIFVFEVFKPKVDLLKVLLMIISHEFGEIINGDPRSPTKKRDAVIKYKQELKAIEYVLREMPNRQKYIKLWKEFEQGKSKEARLVRQLDKLEMAFQSRIYALEHKLDLDEFIESVRPHIRSRNLKGLFQEIERLR